MNPTQGMVVGLGVKVPKVSINTNDLDYEQKSANPDNWHSAVLVKMDDGNVTAVCITPGENYKLGDSIWYASNY